MESRVLVTSARALAMTVTFCAPAALAQTLPIANVSEGTSRPATRANVTIGGYVESFYQWNFNQPSNRVTNYRGFDNRSNAFTLSNVVVDMTGTLGPVSARLALQVGHTPETYYLAEPDQPGAGGAGASNLNVWKYIQQANVAWRAPVGRGLLVEAGLFLSPIGPEGMVIHDQWNWSRSNLFFGCPFYHTGARVTYGFTGSIALTLAGYNGWNSVVDNNDDKSVSLQFTYNVTDRVTFSALYFGGVERADAAPERQGSTAWRHLFDTYLAVYPTPWLSVLVHGDAGFESNAFGTSWWAAGALYARFRVRPWLYLAARGDFFYAALLAVKMGELADRHGRHAPARQRFRSPGVPPRPGRGRHVLPRDGALRRDDPRVRPQRAFAGHSHARHDGVVLRGAES
jgi:hypothetical protein